MQTKPLYSFLFVFATISLLSFLYGCAPVITFSEPQPKRAENLKAFPSSLQGVFESKEDSSKLWVTDKMVVFSGKVKQTVLKKSVDTLDGVRYEGNRILGLDKLYKGPVTYRMVGHDSLEYAVNTTDTLFKLERKNFLRTQEERYYLNKQVYKTSWHVTQLHYNNGLLTVGTISEKNDLPKLVQMKAVHEVKSDSGNVLMYRIHLRKGQFKKFIKNNGFSDIRAFSKIK